MLKMVEISGEMKSELRQKLEEETYVKQLLLKIGSSKEFGMFDLQKKRFLLSLFYHQLDVMWLGSDVQSAVKACKRKQIPIEWVENEFNERTKILRHPLVHGDKVLVGALFEK